MYGNGNDQVQKENSLTQEMRWLKKKRFETTRRDSIQAKMKNFVFEISKAFPFIVTRRKSESMGTDSERLFNSAVGMWVLAHNYLNAVHKI